MDRGAWWATVHGVAESDTAELAHMHTDAYRTLERDRRQRSGRPMSTFRPLTFRESVARRLALATVTAAFSTEASAGTTGRGHGEASLLPNPWAVPHLCLHPSAGRPLVGGLNPTP